VGVFFLGDLTATLIFGQQNFVDAGRIRTAAAPSLKTGQKRACGSFLAARDLPSHPRPPRKRAAASFCFATALFSSQCAQ
jgi:hypothetical protein